MKSTLRRGFTRKELLVAMGLLAVPVALLLTLVPGFKVRRDYRTCQTNLKAIAFALKQYLNDYDEHFPLVILTNSTGTTYKPPYGWADALQPYLKNTQVMQCPSDSNKGDDNSGHANFSDYWYNANFIFLFLRGGGPGMGHSATPSMFGSAPQTIMVGDGGNTAGNPSGNARYNTCGDGSSLTPLTQNVSPENGGRHIGCVKPKSTTLAVLTSGLIHLNGCNFAFADGHVKWVKGSNASQSAQVMNNAALARNIGGKVTFSLLNS